MRTECTRTKHGFHGLGRRSVEGVFDGGEITSDGGGVVLREVEQRTRMPERLGECFEDHCSAARIAHPRFPPRRLRITLSGTRQRWRTVMPSRVLATGRADSPGERMAGRRQL